MTTVSTPQGLLDAVQSGALDIVITDHLDLTNMPLLPTSFCNSGCESPLGEITGTRSIRVRLRHGRACRTEQSLRAVLCRISRGHSVAEWFRMCGLVLRVYPEDAWWNVQSLMCRDLLLPCADACSHAPTRSLLVWFQRNGAQESLVLQAAPPLDVRSTHTGVFSFYCASIDRGLVLPAPSPCFRHPHVVAAHMHSYSTVTIRDSAMKQVVDVL